MNAITEVLPEVDDDVTENDGKAHYVRIKALLRGGPVVALCGKKYVPKIIGGAVMDLPKCKPCVDLFELLRSLDG